MGDIYADMDQVLEISRDKFEELVMDKLIKAIVIVKRILDETNLGVEQIDEVFLSFFDFLMNFIE
jgi:molecular chaperone DnaK (HSP70)